VGTNVGVHHPGKLPLLAPLGTDHCPDARSAHPFPAQRYLRGEDKGGGKVWDRISDKSLICLMAEVRMSTSHWSVGRRHGGGYLGAIRLNQLLLLNI
jgi:hypothetical protein